MQVRSTANSEMHPNARGADHTDCHADAIQPPWPMENQNAAWPERFELTLCDAAAIGDSMATAALGVAVIYAPATSGSSEKILLVVESRARALRTECERRLQTPKLPPLAALRVAFKADALSATTAEAIHASCRAQVILAGELRRVLRPAMR